MTEGETSKRSSRLKPDEQIFYSMHIAVLIRNFANPVHVIGHEKKLIVHKKIN